MFVMQVILFKVSYRSKVKVIQDNIIQHFIATLQIMGEIPFFINDRDRGNNSDMSDYHLVCLKMASTAIVGRLVQLHRSEGGNALCSTHHSVCVFVSALMAEPLTLTIGVEVDLELE